MKLPPLKNSWSLFALAATMALVAAVSGGQEDKAGGAVVEPAPRRATATETEQPAAAGSLHLPLEKFNRPEVGEGEKNLFAAKSWYVPPPPPKPRPPPPPSAPPLPFTFLGTFQESPERLVIFLIKGERIYTVSTGDVIENTYRVEAAADGKLTLRYLPLNIPQILAIGETS